MGKSSKRKKNKVQKITEAEYAAYVNGLKSATQTETPRMPLQVSENNEKI